MTWNSIGSAFVLAVSNVAARHDTGITGDERHETALRLRMQFDSKTVSDVESPGFSKSGC